MYFHFNNPKVKGTSYRNIELWQSVPIISCASTKCGNIYEVIMINAVQD